MCRCATLSEYNTAHIHCCSIFCWGVLLLPLTDKHTQSLVPLFHVHHQRDSRSTAPPGGDTTNQQWKTNYRTLPALFFWSTSVSPWSLILNLFFLNHPTPLIPLPTSTTQPLNMFEMYLQLPCREFIAHLRCYPSSLQISHLTAALILKDPQRVNGGFFSLILGIHTHTHLHIY